MKKLLLFSLSLATSLASAQVGLDPLFGNPVLKQYYEQLEPSVQERAGTDTINLPFKDDFSYLLYPNAGLWMDSNAFINYGYGIQPPTYGVATLDGVTKDGSPYDFSSVNTYGVADYLTSKPINLLPYTLGDSLYLSFFFQAGGRGEYPDYKDSLVLEFKTPQMSTWQRVWGTNTPVVSPNNIADFKQIMLPIRDISWLKKGFQFRFKNYASLSGNVDHWNLDYVRLDRNRSKNDTLIIDASFIELPPSLVKDFYTMPWSHFATNPTGFVDNTISTPINNNTNTTPAVQYTIDITNTASTSVHNVYLGSENIVAEGLYEFNKSINTAFNPVGSQAPQIFEVEHRIALNQDITKRNDTILQVQVFNNYYSYDDGTAENALYIGNPTGGGSSGKFALQYTTVKADSLKAIDIYFNQQLENNANKIFLLCVWADGGNKPGNLIFTKTGQTPVYTNELNLFHRYQLDTALYLAPGTYYFGWIQSETFKMNVGFDRNTNTGSKAFFNTLGTWVQASNLEGSVMLHPVFGNVEAVVGLSEQEQQAHIYPNPAHQEVHINTSQPLQQVEVYNVAGQLVLQTQEHTISVDQFLKGLYFIKVYTTQGTSTHKLIVE